MEPYIALAEKLGCRAVCEGHYLGAEKRQRRHGRRDFRRDQPRRGASHSTD